MYVDEISTLLRDTKSHFNRCKGLKRLGAMGEGALPYIDEVVRLLDDQTTAVRLNALTVLSRLGLLAEPRLDEILRRACTCMQNKGCHFSCCGWDAYRGPMKEYLEVLSVLGAQDDYANIDALLLDFVQEGIISDAEHEEMMILARSFDQQHLNIGGETP